MCLWGKGKRESTEQKQIGRGVWGGPWQLPRIDLSPLVEFSLRKISTRWRGRTGLRSMWGKRR